MNIEELAYTELKTKLFDWFAKQPATAFLSMRWTRACEPGGQLSDKIVISCLRDRLGEDQRRLALITLSDDGNIKHIEYFLD